MKRYKMGLHQFMAIPAFTLFFIFFIYPLIKGIGMSFTDWDGIGKANFIGFQNFIDFFKDKRALSDIRTTVLFALGSAPLLNIIGLLYALLLNSSFKGKSAARMCIYMPAIISPLIMGYIWYLLLQPGRGFLFHLADQAGHPDWFGNWMGGYGTTMLVLILVNVWQYAGMTMVIYLAGLQSIPSELYEAAKVDGAGAIKRFFNVTIPMLAPAITICVVGITTGSLKVYDLLVSSTKGGPGRASTSIIYQTYTTAINGRQYGYGSAMSVTLVLVLFLVALIQVKGLKKKEVQA